MNEQDDPYEFWTMQSQSTLFLEELGHNRLGQNISKEIKVGPNQQGREIKIRHSDRLENQRMVATKEQDPFRNGTLLRRDADQQADPLTASPDALSTEDLFEITELPQEDFEAKVPTLGERPVRRLLELALQMNIPYGKVTYLQEYVSKTYAAGSPQKSLSGNGERLS